MSVHSLLIVLFNQLLPQTAHHHPLFVLTVWPQTARLADTPYRLPPYANRDGILARLVTSFPLLFTISGDVLCLKFGGVWEMLWIFKVARWTHDRCTKINENPTVSSCIRVSSFVIWTANLAHSLTMGTRTKSRSFIFGDSDWKFCKVSYPIGPRKTDIQMQTVMTWD